MYVCLYMYNNHIWRERERCVYIYIYIRRERERETVVYVDVYEERHTCTILCTHTLMQFCHQIYGNESESTLVTVIMGAGILIALPHSNAPIWKCEASTQADSYLSGMIFLETKGSPRSSWPWGFLTVWIIVLIQNINIINTTHISALIIWLLRRLAVGKSERPSSAESRQMSLG